MVPPSLRSILLRHKTLYCLVVLGTLASEATWTSKLDHGSFRGFPSYVEANTLLDEWLIKHPNLIRKVKIGSSFEHRPIHAYILTVKEQHTAKPQIMITSLMHAREPAGLTVVLYFLGRMLELYEKIDPAAVYILENREIWVVPFVNPDGYILNEKHPMRPVIRKNSRPTCKDLFQRGVDLNRNFPTAWEEGFEQGCSEEYRGSAPFSEPETQAIKNMCDMNNFTAALNFHSFGSILTHPYNYAKSPLQARLPNPDDNEIYYELHKAFNLSKFGPAMKVLGYSCAGESDDWLYSAKGIISMSPEVGPESGDFFPDSKMIAGINHRNFARAFHLTAKAGLELGVSWNHVAKPPKAGTLHGQHGKVFATLELNLSNSGLSANSDALLNIAVAFGMPGDSGGFKEGGASVLVTGAGEHLPVKTSLSTTNPVVTFQIHPLPRRSSVAFELFLIGAWPHQGFRNLSLCVFEASGNAHSISLNRVCQCHKPTVLQPGIKADTLAPPMSTQRFILGTMDPKAGILQHLCAAAHEGTSESLPTNLWSTAIQARPITEITSTPTATLAAGAIVVSLVLCALAKRLYAVDRKAAVVTCDEEELTPGFENHGCGYQQLQPSTNDWKVQQEHTQNVAQTVMEAI